MRLMELLLATLPSVDTDRLRRWAEEHALSILIVVIAALVAVRLLERAIPPAIRRAVMREATPLTQADLRKRADTLSAVLLGSAKVAILAVALLMVVGEFGINVAPVIAGLGIGGIAIGLGAQSLVRDAINGILILFENQYGKGDMIKVAGVQGWVEEVNLRRTVLRDADGTLHSVPNSEIKVSSNLTRGFSGVDLLLSLAPGTDVDAAIQSINEVGQELVDDPEVGEDIIEAPRVTRIENATATGLDVRVTGRVTPGAQWKVSSALRRRILRSFDTRSIRLGPAPAPPSPSAAPPAPSSSLPASPSEAPEAPAARPRADS